MVGLPLSFEAVGGEFERCCHDLLVNASVSKIYCFQIK